MKVTWRLSVWDPARGTRRRNYPGWTYDQVRNMCAGFPPAWIWTIDPV